MTTHDKKHLEYTLTTHAVERLVPSKEAIHLCKRMARGTIDADAAVASILKSHGIRGIRTNV